MLLLNPQAPEDLVRRVRSEFIEMPGLRLTLLQAGRLWALPQDDCERILHALVVERFLVLGADGKFGRLSDETGTFPSLRPAKAGLEPHPVTRRFRQSS